VDGVRALVILGCLATLVVAGCGDDEDEQPAAPAPALADLTVRVDRDGRGGAAPREARVRCEAPADSAACRAAAALKPRDLAPVPRDVACTLQYGGPDTATLKGTLRGEAVDARFSRENGCEISRWEAAAPLLEAAG
jgi:hypothetical protein